MTGTPVQHWNNHIHESSFCCFLRPSGSFKHLSYRVVCLPCILSPCCTVLHVVAQLVYLISNADYTAGEKYETFEFYGLLIFTSDQVFSTIDSFFPDLY